MNTVQAIANALYARENCRKSGNVEWFARWTERLGDLASSLPSGAGIDCGTTIDLERSTPNRIILALSFHHMDDGGMYDGWTDHEIWVRPDFALGMTLRITGRDRNGIKDYLGDVYAEALGGMARAAL